MIDRRQGTRALQALLLLVAALLFLPAVASALIPRADRELRRHQHQGAAAAAVSAPQAPRTNLFELERLRAARALEGIWRSPSLAKNSHRGFFCEAPDRVRIEGSQVEECIRASALLRENSRRDRLLFANRFFFQGRLLDPVTELYDWRARWYDPNLGRFLSRDPLGYGDGPNSYIFALGDPVNRVDPMGTLSYVATVDGDTDEATIIQESDAGDYARQRALGYSDRVALGRVMQYSNEWSTVRGRAALMTAGFEAEIKFRQAGKAWLVGAGAIATGGTATHLLGSYALANGLTGASVTLGIPFLGGVVGGLGAQGTSDLIEGQFSGVEAYGWSAGGGGILNVGLAAMAMPGPSILTFEAPLIEPVVIRGPTEYDIAPHGQQPRPRAPLSSHHPVQRKWGELNVPGYDAEAAPTILLRDGARTPHRQITGQQAARRAIVRKSSGTPYGEDFGAARAAAIDQLRAAGVPEAKIFEAILQQDGYFFSLGGR